MSKYNDTMFVFIGYVNFPNSAIYFFVEISVTFESNITNDIVSNIMLFMKINIFKM